MARASIILIDDPDDPEEVTIHVTFEPIYDADSTAHAAAAEIVAELHGGMDD